MDIKRILGKTLKGLLKINETQIKIHAKFNVHNQ